MSTRVRSAAGARTGSRPVDLEPDLSGLQTVTGVALVEWDLVACLGQSDNKNAIYVVQDGSWIVANPNVGTGLEVYATAGSNAGKLYGCDTTGAITWGTTTTSFTLKGRLGRRVRSGGAGPLGATTPSTARFTTLTIVGGTSTSPEANVVNRFAAGDGLTGDAPFQQRGRHLFRAQPQPGRSWAIALQRRHGFFGRRCRA